MYSLEFTYRFEAAHRFTHGSSECCTPHGHTWLATLGFSAHGDSINQENMVEEFKNLKREWKTFLTETVDHSFLHHWQDPILPALHDHISGFRGLPFPGDPTTEMIAYLFFQKASALTSHLPFHQFCKPSFVKIQETPTNSIVYYGENGAPELAEKISNYSGWWNNNDPRNRDFSTT